MSTLSRDWPRDWPRDRPVLSQPPLTRGAPVRHGTAGRDAQARYLWPDPIDAFDPAPVEAAASGPDEQQPTRRVSPPAVPQPQSWPPLPPSEFGMPPAPQVDDATLERGFDPFAAIPSAQFTPAGTPPHQARQSSRGRALPQRSARAACGAAPVTDGFTQGSASGRAMPQDWAGLTDIPAEPRPDTDYSPSRLMYRLNRMWLTPVVRLFVRVGLPVLLIMALVGGYLSDADRRASLIALAVSARLAVENRPEFRVDSVVVQSRSPEVAQGVAQLLDVQFPVSSFQLDLAALRDTAEALDAVRNASLQVRSGVLQVVIEERLPAMIWRNQSGLDLIDANGNRVARLANRAARPDLPLIAGDGAPAAIAEAQLLWDTLRPLRDRLRGLVRVGERRWDVVLDRGQRILLPARDAQGALERVLALNAAQDLLARDVQVIDLRIPSRPTLRLSTDSMDELTRIRRNSSGG